MLLTSHSLIHTPTESLRTAGCVYAEDEAALLLEAAGSAEHLDALLHRRLDGEPLEHVLGWALFCGQRVLLDPGVFVPRLRTELLAQQAIALTRPGDVVVDLCCGSGAVGAALLSACSDVELHASDIDPLEVACARRNLTGAQVHRGDLLAALPLSLRGQVNVMTASTPYVPTDAIRLLPPEARLHEPQVALDGGADGLDVVRRILAEAPAWLAPGGVLLLETSERQAAGLATAPGATVVRCEERDATVLVVR